MIFSIKPQIFELKCVFSYFRLKTHITLLLPVYVHSWEQRKVCNITTSYSGGTPKSGSTEYYDGDIPFIRSGEIYSDKTELFITELGMKNSSAKMVHEGDILYALYGATSGEVSRAKLDGAINQAILAIIPNDDINANFLVEWFRKEKDKITDTYLQGGQGNLSAQIIKELEVTIPSYDEQNKIGLYFEQLNNLITLHQRKCQIDGCRFQSPLAITWEQRKFDDITYPAGEKNRDNLPYESYSVTNENGFIPQNEQFENGGTMATADKSMYYIVSKNSFAYNPARINVGSIGYYDKPENVIVSSLYEVFKTSEDIDDRFLWHWFKSDAFQRMIEQYQEGGVRLYFYYDKLCMCSLPVPDIQEQRKIGKQLDILDNLITLHQCE